MYTHTRLFLIPASANLQRFTLVWNSQVYRSNVIRRKARSVMLLRFNKVKKVTSADKSESTILSIANLFCNATHTQFFTVTSLDIKELVKRIISNLSTALQLGDAVWLRLRFKSIPIKCEHE